MLSILHMMMRALTLRCFRRCLRRRQRQRICLEQRAIAAGRRAMPFSFCISDTPFISAEAQAGLFAITIAYSTAFGTSRAGDAADCAPHARHAGHISFFSTPHACAYADARRCRPPMMPRWAKLRHEACRQHILRCYDSGGFAARAVRRSPGISAAGVVYFVFAESFARDASRGAISLFTPRTTPAPAAEMMTLFISPLTRLGDTRRSQPLFIIY